MKIFLDKFKYIIISLLFLTIVYVSVMNHIYTKEVIEDKYRQRQALVEKSILQTINHINDTYKIAEQQLNREMREYSLLMRDKYRNNPDVMDWDLEALKKKFGIYDIYVISSELKIINTTLEEDLGLDFSKYAGFSKVLRNRLEGDSFVVDRLDLSTMGGEIKKYSYLPTHDNKYLLELSIEVKEVFPVLRDLDVFGDATKITEDYKIVEDISFFSVEPINHGVAKLRSSVEPYLNPDIFEVERELARQSVLSNKVQTTITHADENTYIHKFFPVLISEEDIEEQWNSYVVGIKYNDRVMREEINKHRGLFLINVSVMIVVFIVFILVVVYLLRKFEYLAYHDQLTDLANRKLLEQKFDSFKKEAEKNGYLLAILFLDIDKFKEINDNYGHNFGDIMLKEVANRLQNSLDEIGIVSRLGGDEFIIAVTGINTREEVIKLADKVIEEFKEPLIIKDSRFFIGVSIGISFYLEDGIELEELINNADSAMYKSKNSQLDYILYNKIKGNKY